MKTWDETIRYIRTQPEYATLVEKAYFEEDLKLNVERFRASDEYKETLQLLKQYAPSAKTLLDIGSGNGISAISFALDGFQVTVSEPDPSDTVGAGAIRILKEIYGIEDLVVYEEFAENISFPNGLFDIVYVRQAMHHAYDLNKFIKNLSSLLKPKGILATIRDHVIYDEKDKIWFLENHPLQKFYGGENAFTSEQYREAFKQAELSLLLELKYYDSVINYFPTTKSSIIEKMEKAEKDVENNLNKKIGFLSKISVVKKWYKKRLNFNRENMFNEVKIPGRMYSYITQKC